MRHHRNRDAIPPAAVRDHFLQYHLYFPAKSYRQTPPDPINVEAIKIPPFLPDSTKAP